MRERRIGDMRDGHVVENLVALDDAAVAVRGVFAEADVGDDDQMRHLALDRADGALHRRVGVGGFRAGRILAVGQAEEQHAEDAICLRRRRFLDGFVDRQVEDARHGADLAPYATAFADEERQDEAVGRQPRLAHEAADRLAAAQAPRPSSERESGGGSLNGHLNYSLKMRASGRSSPGISVVVSASPASRDSSIGRLKPSPPCL